jgi:ribonuclease HI
MELVFHTDGGSRGNPGPSGIGFILEHEGRIVCSGGAYIGEATNNVAEYEALIWGLENAQTLGATRIEMIADSELMVKQITGAYKIKNAALKTLAARAHALLQHFESWTFKHTLRAGNVDADALVNEALDTQGGAGEPACAWTGTPLGLFPLED